MTKTIIGLGQNDGLVGKQQTKFFLRLAIDSMIPIIAISEISRLLLASVAEQAGLILTWLQTSRDRFLTTWLIYLQVASVQPYGIFVKIPGSRRQGKCDSETCTSEIIFLHTQPEILWIQPGLGSVVLHKGV